MRTTVDIPDGMYRQLKSRAVRGTVALDNAAIYDIVFP
jgi:hypothetical protein